MSRLIRLTIAMLFYCGIATADENQLTFEQHVRPILKQHCFHCHGEEANPESRLDLRLVRLIRAGGESGTAVVPGNADQSLLFQRLRDREMPPDESKLLNAKEIDTIKAWIAAGAKTRRPEPETLDSNSFITEEERSHWAFQPVARPPIPDVTTTSQISNPIDVFLLAKLEAAGHRFSPRAAPRQLVRRLYFDLLGLPPTPQQLEDGVKLSSRELIDQLLGNSHYGERWASHWLDVAGYADSEGFNDVDAERPHAWRYRDYVIRSLNADKPIDQFIREQLAGDEMITSPLNDLSPEDVELLTATGFLRQAPDGTAAAVEDANAARNETIADTVKIVSSSLMGLTVGCARCHDHRYDPISQADYYRFRAIFDPAFNWKSWRSPAKRLVSLYNESDRSAAAEVELKAKKLDAQRTAKQAEYIAATFNKQLAKLPSDLHELARSAHATAAKERTSEQAALFKKHPTLNVTASSLYLYDRKAADDLKKMAAQAKKARDEKPKEKFVRALTEVAGQRPLSHLYFRGDHDQPKQEVKAEGLTVVSMNSDVNSISDQPDDSPSSGRRLRLAERLVDRQHPLTARAIVNRVWMHHFGRGIVKTPNDFGVLGERPTHPDLLDWLAAELMDNDWSLKHVHRLILSSTVWRQQVRDNEALEKLDPDNDLYGGSMLRRLDAEVVRDSALQIAGKLNTKAFGPPVPVMADRVGRFVVGKENLNAGRPGAVIDMKGEQYRRSIYIQVRRSRPLSVLHTFDRPEMAPNCDRRRPATNATQSLMLLNSDLVIEYSRHFADRLKTTAGDQPESQVQLAWQLCFSRAPDESEIAAATQLLQDQTAILKELPAYAPEQKPKRSAESEALAVLCQMLLSSNEFLYTN